MRARIGDLAIIKISKIWGKKWNERVGIVTGCISASGNVPRKYAYIYWSTKGSRVMTCYGYLPSSRLVRAKPKGGYWTGSLHNLRRDNVEPIK